MYRARWSVSFTHEGLVREKASYGASCWAWDGVIHNGLKKRISTGWAQSVPFIVKRR